MANTIRHTALAGGTGVPAAAVPPTIRHTKLAGSVPVTAPAATIRHTKLTGGIVAGASVGKIRHTKLRGTTAKSLNLQARAGADALVSALTEFTLDGSQSTGNIGGSGDSTDTGYRWTQLPGDVDVPPFSFDDRSSKPTVIAPATWTGYEVTFQLQVTDGVAVSTDTVTVTVRPWPLWRAGYVNGVLQWVPKQRFTAISGTTARAAFTATPPMGPAPLLVQFTDASVNIVPGWQWDFGDGTTSTLQNPSHLYDQVGSYQVTLTVRNSAGTYVSTPQTIDAARPTPSLNLGVHGSSTAEGVNSVGHSLPELLRVQFRPVTVYANGSRGEFIHHTMAWYNARKMAVTLTGGIIPATVTAVAVSAHNFNTTAGNVLSVRTGTLAGVRGKMTWAANVWYFTRTTAGPAVTVPAGSLFTADIGVDQADTVPLFICPDKNGLTTLLDPAASYANLLTLTGAVKTNPARYLVTTNWVNQGASTAERNAINTMNASTRTGYGTKCVDIATYLAGSQVWIDAGMVGAFAQGAPTADDATAQAGGVVANAYLPPSLSSDFQHLNAVGYRLFDKLLADRLVSLSYEPAIQGPLSVFVGNPASLVLADGAAVTSWQGAAGSLETAAATGSSGVTYKAMDPRFNGNPAVIFDGTAGLDTGAFPAARNYDYPLAIGAVFVRTDAASMNLLTGRGTEYAYLGVTGAGMVTMGAGAATQISVAAPAVGVLTYAVAVFNGTSSALYVYDGTTITSATGTTGTDTATAGWPGIRIGSTAAGTGNFMNGGIGWLEPIDGVLTAGDVAAWFASKKATFQSTTAPPVRMVTPLQDVKVSGNVPLRVEIAPSESPTTVEFQVGHKDRTRFPAARVGTTNEWASTIPWASNKSLKDHTTLHIDDAAVHIIPWVNGVQRLDGRVQVTTNNFPAEKDTTVPVWDPALAFTANMASATEFDASFDQVYGEQNDPDGQPTLVMRTEATRGQRMARFQIDDAHTTSDQPNANVRRQVQTPRIITSGKRFFVGWTILTPASPLFPDPGPLFSEISRFQMMGTNVATGSNFTRGLRLMLRAVTQAGANGMSDMLRNHWHIADTDGHWGDPAVMFQKPMAPRDEPMDIIMELEVSDNPAIGGIKIWTRRASEASGALVPYEMFGFPGYYRAPIALVEPGGAERLDLQIYRGRGNYPGKITLDHGCLRIGPTLASVDPANFLTDPGTGALVYDDFSSGTNGANITTTTDPKIGSLTIGANNSITFDSSEG